MATRHHVLVGQRSKSTSPRGRLSTAPLLRSGKGREKGLQYFTHFNKVVRRFSPLRKGSGAAVPHPLLRRGCSTVAPLRLCCAVAGLTAAGLRARLSGCAAYCPSALPPMLPSLLAYSSGRAATGCPSFRPLVALLRRCVRPLMECIFVCQFL